MKYLNPFLPKDATLLLKSIRFIEIGLLCWRNFCFAISIIADFIIVFFFPFLYILSKIFIYFLIYNVLHFL